MADKGKGKGAAVPPPAAPPPAAPPPPGGPAKPGDKKPEDKEPPPAPKVRSVQPKDEVGTRKGCRRYRWEFKDSNKDFWLRGHAVVKIFSMGCLIAAMIFFSANAVHPILTLILTMELSIFIFFFLLYSFAIQKYMYFILWPVTDLLNDLCCCVFLIGGILFAVNIRPAMPMSYLGAVILMGVAAFFALIDVCLQRGHFKGKKSKKNVLAPPPPGAKPPEGKEGEKPPGAPPAPPAAPPAAAPDKAAAAKGKDKGKGKK